MPLFSYLKSSFPKPSYEYFSKLILCNNTTGIDDHAGVILVLIRHIQMIGWSRGIHAGGDDDDGVDGDVGDDGVVGEEEEGVS